jgi:hypothetical protein
MLGMILTRICAVRQGMLKMAIGNLRLVSCAREILLLVMSRSLAVMKCSKVEMFRS